MTAPEIVRVVITVGVVELICDLLAHWRIFSKEPYTRSLEKLSRARFKLDQVKAKEQQGSISNAAKDTVGSLTKKNSKADKNAKIFKRAEDDHANALSNVAQRHTVPSVLTSLVFVILMRILGADLKGKVVAILPFVPYSIFKRITARGLEFMGGDVGKVFEGITGLNDVGQAASFTVIYMLTAASVKYYVHQLVSTKPPAGAESIMAMVDSPQGQHILRTVGIDPADLKAE